LIRIEECHPAFHCEETSSAPTRHGRAGGHPRQARIGAIAKAVDSEPLEIATPSFLSIGERRNRTKYIKPHHGRAGGHPRCAQLFLIRATAHNPRSLAKKKIFTPR
jgi:hypothetical protein